MIVESLVGVFLGTITGLIPGLHPNTLAPFLQSYGEDYSALIVSMAIAHTFLNIIPAAFVGVPEEDTALAIFPAHELVIRGEGVKAVTISAFSSLLSALASLPLFYLLLFAGGFNFKAFYKPVIVATVLYFLINERDPFGGSLASYEKRALFLAVFLTAGLLGLATIKLGNAYLFPLLTGLFGVPALLQSLKAEKIAEQRLIVEKPEFVSVLKGVVAGFFVSMFPGISSGVATGVAASGSKDPESYVAAVSSANTSAAILSLAMLGAGKVRSGVAAAIKSGITEKFVFIIPLLVIPVATLSAALCILLAKPMSKLFSKVDAGKVSAIVLVSLIFSVSLVSGILGLAILFTASLIGLSAYMLRVRPIACMGSIMVPVLL